MSNLFTRLMALLTAGALSLASVPAFAEEETVDTPATTDVEITVTDDSSEEEKAPSETGPCAGLQPIQRNYCLLRERRKSLRLKQDTVLRELRERKKDTLVNVRQQRTNLRQAVHERRERARAKNEAMRNSGVNVRERARAAAMGKRGTVEAARQERLKRARAVELRQQKLRMKLEEEVQTDEEQPADDTDETTESSADGEE